MEQLFKEEQEEKEIYLYGEVLTTPQLKWRRPELSQGKMMTGWTCKLHTNSHQLVNEDVVLNVELVFDLVKWEPIQSGSLLKLSVKGRYIQSGTDEEVLRCNVVIRR